MNDLFISTTSIGTGAPGTPPMPTSPGSLYLVGLLAKQQGLTVARNALNARAAVADADETQQIGVQLKMIQSDYVKIDAMITAYLATSTIYRAISKEGLTRIRSIVEQLQGLVAKRNTVTEVIILVTQLLNEWDGPPKAAANGSTETASG